MDNYETCVQKSTGQNDDEVFLNNFFSFSGFPSRLAITIILASILSGCARHQPVPSSLPPVIQKTEKQLKHLGFTIQVGAFSVVENAARLTDILTDNKLDATYFKAEDGFFKVRFGDFPTKEEARKEALRLKASGIIDVYYIVSPSEYSVARQPRLGNAYLREELVKTTMSFIDIPYLWGGYSPDEGFDCSGLSMTVYRLNGLNLPRTSSQQFEAGYPVQRENLSKGDLVFFSNSNWGKVNHVGIYAGGGKFIHAPAKGKKIRFDSLSNRYFSQRYVGARSYM